ncbi:MAG: diphosphomevalonate decarboxylase [Candidatus Levybacteria bacterium]|nr:diphosphomevalonate decarboxylase [Candidatus Levybacteria bacterium]
MKATAIAPSNIAFIKYWGRKDEELRLPENGSVSMNLSNLLTTTTVEFDGKYKADEVFISSVIASGAKPSTGRYLAKQSHVILNQAESPAAQRAAWVQNDKLNSDKKIIQHLDRIRKMAKISKKAKVVSQNNFPRGTGLSSSASGFAALTVAASNAASLQLSEKELSILARLGSGSACRSIPDGFVEWLDGDTSDTSYAHTIFPPDHWDIVDVAVILTEEVKDVSTSEGQKSARTSPFYELRLQNIKNKIANIKDYIKDKKFQAFGEIVEQEALELHAIMLTSTPSLIYWYPATITVMKHVKKWRKEGLEVYFTMNTGQNIHLMCEGKDKEALLSRIKELPDVKDVIVNTPAKGTQITQQHLF